MLDPQSTLQVRDLITAQVEEVDSAGEGRESAEPPVNHFALASKDQESPVSVQVLQEPYVFSDDSPLRSRWTRRAARLPRRADSRRY